MNFAARAAELSGWMVDVRRDLHRNPELSFREERTGGIVAARAAAGADAPPVASAHERDHAVPDR